MKNPTGNKIGKFSYFHSGGINHLRYDHKSRPTLIEIKCPSCEGLAIAKDEKSFLELEFISNMSQSWND